jgi:hypothetical protein
LLDFKDSPLGDFAMRYKRRTNFINKFNNFWMWSEPNNLDLWKSVYKSNPFDDGDVSVVEFMKVQLKK